MHGMGWSWAELQETPPYVKRYCWDTLQIRYRIEADQMEEASREARNG